jgi:CheY-like chemotaxis protein
MLLDQDSHVLDAFTHILREAGYGVVAASSGQSALNTLRHQSFDLVLSELELPDLSGFELLRYVKRHHESTAFVVVSKFNNIRDVVAAIQLGAADFLDKPVLPEELLGSIHRALTARSGEAPRYEAHAAARWARMLVAVIPSPRDPRTIADWSRVVFASPGALRNWCRMAGTTPRRSLVFARLLRAVALADGERKPENLLDVVDRRTLVGLLRLAGLNPRAEFPTTVDVFLQRQILIRDADALLEIRRALEKCRVQPEWRQRASDPTNGVYRSLSSGA